MQTLRRVRDAVTLTSMQQIPTNLVFAPLNWPPRFATPITVAPAPPPPQRLMRQPLFSMGVPLALDWATLLQQQLQALPPVISQNDARRFGSCTLQVGEQTGFRIVKMGRNCTNVFDVVPTSAAYRAGLRDYAVLTFVNGVDARASRLSELREAVYIQRPLRISWENTNRPDEVAAIIGPSQLQQARVAATRTINNHLHQQRRRRVLGHGNVQQLEVPTPDDVAEVLAEQHARLTKYTIADMELREAAPCSNCGFRLFMIEPENGVKICCTRGACLDHAYMPKLRPMPTIMREHLVNHCAVLSFHSLEINQSLNIAAVGLEPTRAQGGRGLTARMRQERVQCLSFHGRLYRHIRPSLDMGAPAK